MSVSTEQPDHPPETAKSPWSPTQYIGVILLVVVAIGGLYLFIDGAKLWHSAPPKHVERSDSGASVPYVGPPGDIKEAAAKQAVMTRPVQAGPAAIDESAAFNSPIMGITPSLPAGMRQLPQATGDEATAAPASGSTLLLPKAFAYRVPHPTYTIRKGTLIPCTDVTAIDTGTGGNVLISATIPMDVWSMDHHMVLLDKGTSLVGEVGHGLVNGLDRLAVVWREATTPPPDSVGVNFDSPAAGPLGEGGLDGDVNRHEWQKVKGVVLLSLLQGSLNIAQAEAQSKGSTNINFGSFTNGADQAGSILLQSQINIPDTIHRDQGLACSAFLARDLDFSKVYSARVRQ